MDNAVKKQDILEIFDDIDAEQFAKLDQFPYLKEYLTHYYETGGESEKAGLLPKFIVWIRDILDGTDIDPAQFFDMDEETAEDFYTWGHNSRWNITFRGHLDCDPEQTLDKCLALAERFGDREVVFED